MASGVYLIDNPPVRDQYRSPRRARPTGLTVVHTAESVLDVLGPDTGAEAVAAFIQRRTTPGSYHDLVDSDTALQLVRYGDEAYQDGTGSNPYAMSISFALRTTDWRALTPERRQAFLRQGAVAFRRQQAWLREHGYPTTPRRWITREESERGAAGFIRHSQRDPARRTDPGADFPADEFFEVLQEAGDMTTPRAVWDHDLTQLDPPYTAQARVWMMGTNAKADAARVAAITARDGVVALAAPMDRVDDRVAEIHEVIVGGSLATGGMDPAAVADRLASNDAFVEALAQRIAAAHDARARDNDPTTGPVS